MTETILKMPCHRLIIALPGKDLSKLRQLFPLGEAIHFLYLGQDFFKRRQLDRELGANFSRIDIAALHDRVARDLRSDHIKWIDQLNRRNGKDLEWWFTPTASRNIYVSNLFQYSCYLEILARVWRNSGEKPELIIVESPGLAAAIREWATRQGIEAQVISARTERSYVLSNYLTALLKLGYFIAISLLRQIAAYTTKRKFGKKTIPKDNLAIVDTFVHDFSLSDRGVFHDSYFHNLYEYLEKHDYQPLVHPVLHGFSFNYCSIYKRLRQSSNHFIIPEDYLYLSDYIHVLTYPLKTYRHKIKAEPFHNFDLSGIINEDHTRGLGDSSSLLAGLIYRLFLRLQRTGLRPQLIINWYENQVIDKALMAAARRAFPQATIVGAQILLHSYNMLFLFPIASEVEAGITPHLLLAMSEHLCQFARTFTKDIPCRPAGALRYDYIFQRQREVMASRRGSAVLVLLPHNIPESVEILEILKMGLDRLHTEARFLIKCHPDYTSQDLQRSFGEQHWPARFEFYRGPLADAFKEAAVAISSNSGSIVEAAALGIPVIFVGRQTALNHNILEDVEPELIMECFNEKDLMTSIKKCLNLTIQEIEPYKALGERILKLFFLPVTEDTMRPFLGDISTKQYS